MPIQSITTEFTGEIGVSPRMVRITCNDDADTIMAENYLQSAQKNGYTFYPTDFINVSYLDGFGVFQPEMSNGNITLVSNNDIQSDPDITGNLPMYYNQAAVLTDSGIAASSVPVISGATVVGDIPKFSTTSGGIVDSGASFSNAAKTKIAMADAATVTNNLVKATDTAGTIGDAGIAAADVSTFSGATVTGDVPKFSNTTGTVVNSGASFSDATKTKIVMANAATVVGNLIQATDTAGTIGDAGVTAISVQNKNLIKADTVAHAGGSASFSIAAPTLTSSSVCTVNFATQVNPASILTCAAGTDIINIVASADPGTCTVNYVALTAAQ